MGLIDKAEVQRAWSLLAAPGQVVEVRALEATLRDDRPYYKQTVGGFFDNIDDLLKALQRVQQAQGIYITIQDLDPDLLHRAKNKIVPLKKDYSTPDKNVLKYRWLPIDFDINRSVKNISSTDEEHTLALDHAQKVRAYLSERGWPDPIEADSGNGAHLLYRVNLPIDDGELIKRTLTGIAESTDTPAISLDQTVYNPARIWKLYGSLVGKGDNTPERPHRVSRLLVTPEQMAVVNRQLLDLVAVPAAQQKEEQPQNSVREKFTAEDFLLRYHIDTYPPTPYAGGMRWLLKRCVWDSSHTDHSACVFQFGDGRLGASCSHNSCSGKGWREFRLTFEPDAYTSRRKASQQEKQQEPTSQTSDYWLAKLDADDSGNGDALHALHGKDFLWCSSRGWFRYCGTHWKLDPDGAEIKKRTVEVLRRRRHAAVDAKLEAVIKCCKADDSRVNGAISRFKTLSYVSIDEFDADPDLLNCRNGVVDLRTGRITPHRKEQRFTYCVPVEYKEVACPEWIEYLNGVVGGGPEVVDYLQQLAGYSLTGHTREEILVYLHGPTRSGKGTWAETFMSLLPDPIATMVDFNSFTAKREGDVSNFDLAPLKPSRMIFASESQRNQSLNPAKIKQLTGGDQIRACYKHRDFFAYRPQFKVWMLSNHPVNGDPEDDALWARVRVIAFPNSFLGIEDKGKKARLKDPDVLQGVLWWAVQGAIKWYQQGAKGLNAPEAVVKKTQEHRAELDYVQQWLDECCHDHEEGWMPNEVVTASYMNWCKQNNVQYPKGPKALAQSLKAKGYEPGVIRKENGKTKRGVGGLHIFVEEKTWNEV